ncbi:hypothetical protein Rhopal_002465-T1 [Rhodotorula paludigena]|uniref:Uncharacterized protein n=1 Tax=Rhodotorula paludigena TaxID=86838 RepID=A0AAV5GJT9_9BASI|nr:hypothetical protein Rhopal_002465-T1 [Rhodotorula paludigena]
MHAEPVTLYVYDLSGGLAAIWGQQLTGRPVEGIWHTALVLYGMEVFFGQGISIVSPPGTTHHGQPRKKIPCGVTHLDKETFLEYIEGLRETYTADAYHLLEFNCNTFTNDVLGFLNGGSIPEDIRNQPQEIMSTPFGQSMRPMIEQMFVGARRPTAGAAVNNLLPQLGVAPPAPAPISDDVPSTQSVASNLSICTSVASLRSILASSPATAIMYTSLTCPPCTAIKPFFESLAAKHASPSKRIAFVLVETHLGAGAEVARSAEFGGPVRATPTFVFFARGEKVGECKGADRGELETQVGMLELAAYPPHPHTKLALPALKKLAGNLRPVTAMSFPPLPALKKKLEEALKNSDNEMLDVLSKGVPQYLATLPAPPAPPSAAPLPASLLEAWLPATLRALQALSSPSAKFPVLDLVRLALARDSARLGAQLALLSFLPSLLSHLASDLDHPSPDRSYLLTALRVSSNALLAPPLAARLLAPDVRPALTRLIVRALLDPEDPKIRSAGAGAAWSVVARVSAARIGEGAGEARAVESEGEHAIGVTNGGDEGGEEWEAEVASAVLEALGKEEESVESPYFAEVSSLLEVLEAPDVLKRKEETVKKVALVTKEDDVKDVLGVLKDVQRLLES